MSDSHENQLPCAAVLYGYGSREEFTENGADYQIETVEELGDFLMKWGEV